MYNDNSSDFVTNYDLKGINESIDRLERKVDWIVKYVIVPSLVGKIVNCYVKGKLVHGTVVRVDKSEDDFSEHLLVFIDDTRKVQSFHYLDLELSGD